MAPLVGLIHNAVAVRLLAGQQASNLHITWLELCCSLPLRYVSYCGVGGLKSADDPQHKQPQMQRKKYLPDNSMVACRPRHQCTNSSQTMQAKVPMHIQQQFQRSVYTWAPGYFPAG
eukprot:1158819-Pelagomonas_calceolata.AAC.2